MNTAKGRLNWVKYVKILGIINRTITILLKLRLLHYTAGEKMPKALQYYCIDTNSITAPK